MTHPSLFDLAPDIQRDTERLVELAKELGLKAGRHGVCVSDLRIMAVTRGILTGEESEARMNALRLGKVMIDAGLKRNGDYRRSSVPRAKRSLNAVYTIVEFAEVA